MNLRWQLVPGQLLGHRSWHGEHVLFNNLSGDTHLLGDDALSLLLDLRDGPIGAAEFSAGAATDVAATDQLLSRLAVLGLIESRPC